MTICNCCGAALPAKNQLAFLSGPCAERLPLPVLMRYRCAALEVHIWRRRTNGAVPVPPALVDELARSWSAAAEIARANTPDEESP